LRRSGADRFIQIGCDIRPYRTLSPTNSLCASSFRMRPVESSCARAKARAVETCLSTTLKRGASALSLAWAEARFAGRAVTARPGSCPDTRRSRNRAVFVRRSAAEDHFSGASRALTRTPNSTSRLRRSKVANARLPVETTPHIPNEGICGPPGLQERLYQDASNYEPCSEASLR
jgi:hypothetical protein